MLEVEDLEEELFGEGCCKPDAGSSSKKSARGKDAQSRKAAPQKLSKGVPEAVLGMQKKDANGKEEARRKKHGESSSSSSLVSSASGDKTENEACGSGNRDSGAMQAPPRGRNPCVQVFCRAIQVDGSCCIG